MTQLGWDDLRYAHAVAQSGTLAEAARSLGVTHSTVLRRIDALEARLGVRLFERRRDGYSLTEAGEVLAKVGERVALAVDEAERRIVGRDLQLTGRIRVSTSNLAMQHLLPPALAAFAARYPGIEVEVAEARLPVDLARGEADISIPLSQQIPDYLVGRKLGEVSVRAYALRGAAHLPQRRQPLDKLLTQAPWIIFERDARELFYDRWMHANVPDAQVRMRVYNFSAALNMVRTGLGVALLPTFIERGAADIVAVSDAIESLQAPMWLVTHPDLRYTARIRAFMRTVGDAVAAALRRRGGSARISR